MNVKAGILRIDAGGNVVNADAVLSQLKASNLISSTLAKKLNDVPDIWVFESLGTTGQLELSDIAIDLSKDSENSDDSDNTGTTRIPVWAWVLGAVVILVGAIIVIKLMVDRCAKGGDDRPPVQQDGEHDTVIQQDDAPIVEKKRFSSFITSAPTWGVTFVDIKRKDSGTSQ